MRASLKKILKREEVADKLIALKSQNKTIGFTSGVFDLIHAGHVDYLEQAKEQCDVLIVAVNSDSSVRQNKGEKRPIVPQGERARIVAGLQAVDFVFVFSELNNNQNIEFLSPSIYFKAGDYDKSKLSSAGIVESYGGKVVIVPPIIGKSTTTIIEDIAVRYNVALSDSASLRIAKNAPAVFLDRDGTINELVEYLHEPEKFKLVPGALDALKNLRDAGYRLVVVTNQPGIGLGYFTKEDFFKVNKEFFKQLSAAGVYLDKIYYCGHSKSDNCNCRKPNTAMIDRAVEELNIDLSASYMIGDMTGDIMLGKNVGCKTILVETGQAGKDGVFQVKADYTVASIREAAGVILGAKS